VAGAFDETHRLVQECHVVGITSNPTIFANAISGSDSYDDQIAALAEQELSAAEALQQPTSGRSHHE